MTRKVLLLAAAIMMMFAFSNVGAPSAEAQTCKNYYNQIISCGVGTTQAYPAGGFSNAPGSAAAGGSTASAGTTSGSTAAATSPTTLAITGADSGLLGYIGAGLIGAGGLALGAARRRNS